MWRLVHDMPQTGDGSEGVSDATADANLSPAEVPHPRNTPVVWLRELTVAKRVWKK